MEDVLDVIQDYITYIAPVAGLIGLFIIYTCFYAVFICICTTFYCYCLWPCWLCCMGGGCLTGLNTKVKHKIFGLYTLLFCLPGPGCVPICAIFGICGILCCPPTLVLLFPLAWCLPIHPIVMGGIVCWMCSSCCFMMGGVTCSCYLCGNCWMLVNPRTGDGVEYKSDTKSKRFSAFEYEL